MNLTLVTPPAVEPVSLAEAKEHLRVLHDDDDAYIESLIPAARQMVESGESWSLERSLITTTWKLSLDRFENYAGLVELPRPPVIEVVSVVYTNSTGTPTTLAESGYTLDNMASPARLIPSYGNGWPTVRYQPNTTGVAITYTAGYGDDPEDVPQAIRQAILLCVGDLYEMRQNTVTGAIVNVLPAVRTLLNGFKWSYR